MLRVEFFLNTEYHYAVGHYGTRFFTELRDHARIMGMRCPECGRVYIPPRPVCGICYRELQEWVEVGPEGTIVGWTVVRIPFIDPMTGEQRPVPYGFAIIRLDGASTSLYHFLDETDESKIAVGKRVRAVFREQREGSLRDILYFRLLED
ncbi:MAG: Zn-ribbon domain-containing OB-fold protein [Blastocatellia bacterium]|nr:Zn-ribbon domain-containing OB-fold protein [Blastocatellia bacterium]